MGRPVPEYPSRVRVADPRLFAVPLPVRRVHAARARFQGRRVTQPQNASLPHRPRRHPAGHPVQRPSARRRARLGGTPAPARDRRRIHGNRDRHGPALPRPGGLARRGPHPPQARRMDRDHGTAGRLLSHGYRHLPTVHSPRVAAARRARHPARLRAGGVDVGAMGRLAGLGASKALYGRARAPYGMRLHLVERAARPRTRAVGNVPGGHVPFAAEKRTADGRIHGGLVPVLQIP